MNIMNIFKFALDGICRHFITFMVSVCFATVSFILLMSIVVNYGTIHSNEISFKSNLAVEDDQMYILNNSRLVDAENEKKQYEYKQEIESIEGVSTAQYVIESDGDSTFDNYDEGVKVLDLVEKGYLICDLYTDAGEKVEFKENGKDIYDTYVGYDYRDTFPVGTILHKGDIEFVVKGVLKKDSKWICELDSMSPYQAGVINLNDYIVTCHRSSRIYSSNGLITIIDDKADKDNCIEQIKSVAQKYRQYFSIMTVDERFEEVNQYYSDEDRSIKILFILFAVLALISMSFTVIVNIYKNKKTYGIFYSAGVSTADIIKSLVTENIIKFLMGAIIALTWLYINCMSVAETKPDSISLTVTYNYVFLRYCLTSCILCVILCTALSTVIPVILLSRKTPVQLLEGVRQ